VLAEESVFQIRKVHNLSIAKVFPQNLRLP